MAVLLGVSDASELANGTTGTGERKSCSVLVTSTSADSAPRMALGLDIRTVAIAVSSSRNVRKLFATSDASASTVRNADASTN